MPGVSTAGDDCDEAQIRYVLVYSTYTRGWADDAEGADDG